VTDGGGPVTGPPPRTDPLPSDRPTTGVVRHRAKPGRLLLVVAAAAGVLVAAGAAVALTREPAADRPPAATASPTPAPFGVDPSAFAGAGEAATQLPPPERVRIPAIGIDSALEPLGLDRAGALNPPTRYDRAGWYSGGPAPGDQGPAVLAGHVDSRDGPAVFFRLSELKPGDQVEVARGDRWVAFRVVATERYAKDRFPAERVYRPTPVAELRLITCGGAFDGARRSYADNLVVYAVAA